MNKLSKTWLKKLLSLSGAALGPKLEDSPNELLILPTLRELGEFLTIKNGFFAFENALHIFPFGSSTVGYDVMCWNNTNLWRDAFNSLTESQFFFAEDIFGEQFSIYDGCIWRFNPETGQKIQIAENLEEWAQLILQNYEEETGQALAHAWQEYNGMLPVKNRLIPKIPFVLGGVYQVDNLYSINAVEGMIMRADIAKQIINLPDNTVVKLKVVD